jgi:chromosome segregation ATPase
VALTTAVEAALRAQLHVLTQQRDAAMASAAASAQGRQQSEARVASACDEAASSNQRALLAETHLAGLRSAHAVTTAALSNSEHQCAAWKQQLDGSVAHCQQQMQAHQATDAAFQDVSSRLAAAQKDGASLPSSIQLLEGEVARLRGELLGLQHQCEAGEQTATFLRTQVDASERALSQVREENRLTHSNLDAVHGESEAFRLQTLALTQRLQVVELHCVTLESLHTGTQLDLSDRAEETQQTIADLTGRLRAAQTADDRDQALVSDLSTQLAAEIVKQSDLRAHVLDLEAEVVDMTAAIQAARADKERVELRLAQRDGVCASLNHTIALQSNLTQEVSVIAYGLEERLQAYKRTRWAIGRSDRGEEPPGKTVRLEGSPAPVAPAPVASAAPAAHRRQPRGKHGKHGQSTRGSAATSVHLGVTEELPDFPPDAGPLGTWAESEDEDDSSSVGSAIAAALAAAPFVAGPLGADF